MSNKGVGPWGLAAVFGMAAVLINPLWVDPAGATRTLDNAGFSHAETTGYGWFKCGKGDLWHTNFKAQNPNGKEVTGTVCKGLLKGSTVRFD
jgi:hypothetical protein